MNRLTMKRLPLGALALLAACSGGQSGQEPASAGNGTPAAAPAPPTSAPRASDENELLSQAERLQSNLNAILAANSQVNGSWYIGDATSEFKIFFDGDRETYAEEHVKLGDSGTAWRQYFFEDGSLAFYVEEGRRVGSAAGPTGADSVVVILAFDPDGEVRSFYKTVGGAPADLGESEVAMVRESLARLRDGARQAGP